MDEEFKHFLVSQNILRSKLFLEGLIKDVFNEDADIFITVNKK
jgi:hypothetical protein